MAGKQGSYMMDHSQGNYITEKIYMILQLFLNNKCQPSIELVNLLSSDNFNLQYLQ